jgi:hypothetical protein
MKRATGTTRKEMAFASKLVQLRAKTTIVADTSDIKAVAGFKPTDCTTNPTIVLKMISAQNHSATLSSKPSPWGGGKTGDPRYIAACYLRGDRAPETRAGLCVDGG